jgi:hypothetical protein
VLLDGTLIPARRRTGTASRRNYNGKHNKHGRLFLALTDESGNLIWISSARRGAAGEITATRHDHRAARLRAAGPGALADPRVHRPGSRPRRPRHHHRLEIHRDPQDHPRPAARQPGPVRRPRPRRARLQRP